MTIDHLIQGKGLANLIAAVIVLWGLTFISNPERATAGHGRSRDYASRLPSGGLLVLAIYAAGILLVDWALSASDWRTLPALGTLALGVCCAIWGGLVIVWRKPVLQEDHAPGRVNRVIILLARWLIGPAIIIFGLAIRFGDFDNSPLAS